MSNKRNLLEKEVVCGLILNEKKVPEVAQVISVDDFIVYAKHYQIIYDAWQSQKNVMTEMLSAGIAGSEYAELIEFFSTRPVTFAAKELKEYSTAYKIKHILARASDEIPSEGIEDFVSDLQQQIIQSSSGYTNESGDTDALLAEFEEYRDVYKQKKLNGGQLLGISTGYQDLDNLIDGLRPEHLWVLGGYTSMGKTFAALNIASNLIKNKHRVVVYSLEMSRVDIISRVLGIITHENGSTIAKGYADESAVAQALKKVRESNFGVFNEKHEVNQILLSMYEEHLKNPVSLFVIDFLQLIKVKGARSEYETATTAIVELQKAAKRFQVPIIVLSQVSNESARNTGDTLVMGFKSSGGIAAAADLAIELTSGEDSIKTYREKMNEGKPVWVKWQIRKNRHGRVGFLEMEFTSRTGVFEVLTEEKKSDF